MKLYRILLLSTILSIISSASSLTSIKVSCINDKIAEACYTLTLVYSKGFGANKDIEKAKYYYNLANKYGIDKTIVSDNITFDSNNSK